MQEGHCPGELQRAESGINANTRDKCRRPAASSARLPCGSAPHPGAEPRSRVPWGVGGVTAVWFGGPLLVCGASPSPHPGLILQALSKPVPSPAWESLGKQQAGTEADKEQPPTLPICLSLPPLGCGQGRKQCPAEAGRPWCICSRTQTCQEPPIPHCRCLTASSRTF